jgi:hypothetical protein
MLKQFLFFLVLALLLLGVSIVSEKLLSPGFDGCVNSNIRSQQYTSNRDNPPNILSTVAAYADCSGYFLNRNGAGITALATIVIAAFTGTLWRAASLQASLAEASIVAGNRAYVSATGLSPVWEQPCGTNGPYFWRFRPNWENSGSTPTKEAKFYVSGELINSALPLGFDFTQMSSPYGTGLSRQDPL